MKLESYFQWYKFSSDGTPVVRPRLRMPDIAAAFTVAELGEMLPAYLLAEEQMRFDVTMWKDASWHVAYWWDEDSRRLSDLKIETIVEATEADARAKMVIYLY